MGTDGEGLHEQCSHLGAPTAGCKKRLCCSGEAGASLLQSQPREQLNDVDMRRVKATVLHWVTGWIPLEVHHRH